MNNNVNVKKFFLLSEELEALPSFCVSNPIVIKSILRHYRNKSTKVLFEATSNQVNHLGGYTGMTPFDYRNHVEQIALQEGFPIDRLCFGGDHLGPLPFAELPSDEAMNEAKKMVKAYVEAGFLKLHIDTSMRLGGDSPSLEKSCIASRGAELINYAEGCIPLFSKQKPWYVIGSEVPPAGGQKGSGSDTLIISTEEDVEATIDEYKTHISKQVWTRVIALVIQPGVEYGGENVVRFNSEKFTKNFSEKYQSPLVFEAHSTDYQTKESLRSLVKSGFFFLKVGPVLTMTLRETLVKLELIERMQTPNFNRESLSGLNEYLLDLMKNNPRYWENYYLGDSKRISISLQFSLLNRSRYYFSDPQLQIKVEKLLENLKQKIHPGLIRMYFPQLFYKTDWRLLTAEDLIDQSISEELANYDFAVSRK